MSVKRVVFWLHLVCGVVAGSVILIMSATGVLLAFEPQIVEYAERHLRSVTPPAPGAPRLTPDALLARIRETRPEARPQMVSMRAEPTSAVRVSFGRDDALHVDPYTGRVLGAGSRTHDVMHAIEDWHRWLGSRERGRPVTGACNLAFLGLALTGVYLWWPRRWNRHALGAAVRTRLDLRGRARDWNWHTTVGFWCAPVLVILTLTGAVMSYQWASNLLYTLTGNVPPPPPTGPGPVGIAGPGAPGAAGARPPGAGGRGRRGATPGERPARAEAPRLDPLWARAESQVPGWVAISLRLPPRPGAPVTVFIQEPAGWHPAPRSVLTLDAATAGVVRWEPFAGQNLGRRLRAWVRVLHTGEAAGVPGQLVAGLASAGGALLVWTGLALAWRRWRGWRARARGAAALNSPAAAPAIEVISRERA
jgi:uncharacterized iron-regulated membrane protein